MAGMSEDVVAALAEMPTIPRTRTAHVPTKSGGSYSYSYADLANIVETVRPILAAHGLAVIQQPCQGAEGGMALLTTLLHTSGDTISSVMPLGGVREAQATGSILTYARRYALVALLGLATEDDDDAQHADPAPPAKRGGPRRASDKQLGMIHQLARDLKVPRSVLEALAEEAAGRPIASSKELTPAEASALIDALQDYEVRSPDDYSE